MKTEVKLAPIEAVLGEIEGKVWTLPAERMKGGKEPRVPLSAPAMVIVEEMRRESTAATCYSPGKRNGPQSNIGHAGIA